MNRYVSYITSIAMGIVKVSESMHENLRVASQALSRSINAQAEHWLRIGMLSELHPELDHRAICRMLIAFEQSGGFDLSRVTNATPAQVHYA